MYEYQCNQKVPKYFILNHIKKNQSLIEKYHKFK